MVRVSPSGDEEIVLPAYIERPDGLFVPVEAAGLGDFSLAVAFEWHQAKMAGSPEARAEHERRAQAFDRVGGLIRAGVNLFPPDEKRHVEWGAREPISPELVLVDPELAERTRHNDRSYPTSGEAT